MTSTPDASILRQCLVVDQAGSFASAPADAYRSALLSPQQPLAVAIVDRSADIAVAAREIAKTRLRLVGRSTQGIDLVLVNEFVAESLAVKLAEALWGSSEEKATLPWAVVPSGERGSKLYEADGLSIIKIGQER